MKKFIKTQEGWYKCPYCNAGTWHPEDHAANCIEYVKAERDYYKKISEKEKA